MSFTFEFAGIDELYSRLDTTVQRISRETNKIVKDSAEPIREEIKRTVPILQPEPKHPDEGHAVDDVQISRVRTKGYIKTVDVGFKKTEWRMWFLEYGTHHPDGSIRITPRHYVEKALISQKGQVLSIQAKRLKEVVDRRGL